MVVGAAAGGAVLIVIVIVTVVVLKRKRVICASNVNKPEKRGADAENAKSPSNSEYVEVPQTDSNQNKTM